MKARTFYYSLIIFIVTHWLVLRYQHFLEECPLLLDINQHLQKKWALYKKELLQQQLVQLHLFKLCMFQLMT